MKHTIAALSCAAVLAVGLTACSGSDEKSTLPAYAGGSGPSATVTSPPTAPTPTRSGPVPLVPHATSTDGGLAVVVDQPANIPKSADQDPPQPPVPSELLRDIAVNNLKLPDPRLVWNPKMRGNQGTLVNLDTWFWLDNAPGVLTVHASAGGNGATVSAALGGMEITAHGEEPLSCTGPGHPDPDHQLPVARPARQASGAGGLQPAPARVISDEQGLEPAHRR